MPEAGKRPCSICRRWFRPDPRIGSRQRACRNSGCQATRRVQTQKSWRDRNADYFVARRIQERGNQEKRAEPLRLPPPLNELHCDIAQDQFGVQGADFIGVFGTVLLRAAQDQFKAYPIDSTGPADTLPPEAVQDQIQPVRECIRVATTGNEAGISPTRPPV